MHAYRALLKSFGRRISAITGMNAEVPADEMKMVVVATIAPWKVGDAKA
jgi:hypothetical protein